MTRSSTVSKAKERGRYLEATTDLRGPEADAVAYSELGYSNAGIAEKIDTTESTVGEYLDRAIAQYGPEAAHARAEFDPKRDLDDVTAEQIADWPDHYRDVWRDAVESHPDRAPDAATPDVIGDENDGNVGRGSA